MFKYINQCDVYVGLWCIYMLQDVLYPAGIINQFLQLIMLVWSMIAVFKYLLESRTDVYSSILKATLLLMAMYIIYGGIHIMFGESIKGENTYYYLQSSLNSLAPIFLFYYFTMNGKLTSDRIRIYLPILIVICILLYYKNESQVLLAKDAEEITNNMGYLFVSLIPLLFFFSKKPIIQYLLLAIIHLYVLMGMKRGAILICVISTIILLYANLKESSRWTKILIVTLTLIFTIGVGQYINYMMDNNAYFSARVENTLEGNSSGRDVIYGKLWDTLLLESRPLYFFFGRGANSTITVVGTVAHQDWLETFCNNGLFGIFILLFFFYTFGKNVLTSRWYFPRMMFYAFITLFIIIYSTTLFSMSIQNIELSSSLLLGYFAFKLSNFNEIYG